MGHVIATEKLPLSRVDDQMTCDLANLQHIRNGYRPDRGACAQKFS